MSFTYKYARPALTVDAIVTAEKNGVIWVLLIRRKFDPFAGDWALPGGFVDMDETLVESCSRELREETGLEGVELEQFFTFDSLDRDPRGRTISVVFSGLIDAPVPLNGADDAEEAKWFPIISLPEMAFDHNIILKKFVVEKL